VSANVTIVDYGSGNLFSVARAVERVGGVPLITSNPNDIAKAERLLVPGVGAFEQGISGLRGLGLIEPIRQYAFSGRPILGICLGMQLLASRSEEFGLHEGLGLIPGRVVRIPHIRSDGTERKIPVIGWFNLAFHCSDNSQSSVLGGVPKNGSVYLVHSYHYLPDSEADLIATYDCDGVSVTAAVQRENIIGLQFHPEKSGEVGLGIIASFLSQERLADVD